MANLRNSFEATLRRYGHNIILQRRENEYASATPSYTRRLERHTVRHMHPSSRLLANLAIEMSEGIVHDSEMIYFFKWDSNPASGDRIYENIDLYPNSMSTFLIDKSIPMRGRGGRIEFWVCGVSQERPT
jgi:hypothetical protein